MLVTNNIIKTSHQQCVYSSLGCFVWQKDENINWQNCSRYAEINNKEFYFIVTAADNNKHALERTLEEFIGFTTCLDGAKEKGIKYGTETWNIGDIKKNEALKQACEMCKKV